MESKVKIATRKVVNVETNLKTALEKKNTRLVNKYALQLRDTLDELDQVCISAEVDGADQGADFLLKANEVSELASTLTVEADEYLLGVEEAEEAVAIKKVNSAKLKEFSSLLACFRDGLSMPVDKLTLELDSAQHIGAIEKLISDRRKQMKVYEDQKIEFMSQIEEGDEEGQELEGLYRSTAQNLSTWVEAAIKFTGKSEQKEAKCERESKRGPGLKLDRLALPIFSGNIRNFAKFIREFENTVGLEFKDPTIKVMYLQNQCLSGKAKDLVRNLTTYDEVMSRLKEKYGNVSVVIDTVLKDIGDLKLHAEEPVAIITLSRTLEMAWDDMAAIKSTDEFCNVITLRTIEGKLPQRLQTLWAQEKTEHKYQCSKEAMSKLRVFIEKQRGIAEEVIAMRGKSADTVKIYQHKNRNDERKLVNSVNVGNPKKGACFRCGFTNHQVKDCKIPPTLKCRRCQRPGHIENACRKPPLTSNDQSGHGTDVKDTSSQPQNRQNGHNPGTENGSQGTKLLYNANIDSNVRLPIETVYTEFGPCLALWDSGSMLNLVSEGWVSSFGLRGKTCNLEFKVVDGSNRTVKTNIYEFSLKSKSNESKIIKAYGLDSLAASVNSLSEGSLKTVLQSLNSEIDINDINNPSGNIQLLLGSQLISDFPEVLDKNESICIMSSKYGTHSYFVVGQHVQVRERLNVSLLCNAQAVRVTPTHDICSAVVMQMEEMKDFMSVEELGIRPPPICRTCKNCKICRPASQFLSLREHRELSVIKSKICFDEQVGEWTASYPYKRDPSVLKDNYVSAFRALKRKENRLLKNAYLFENYSDQIKDFVKRGVIRKMKEEELKTWTGPVRYVDHREVIKEGSTTPVRIVINSSFRDGNDFSLNDILMKGPNVLTSLLQVLVKWRLFPVAFIGDISKMYHCVKTGELEANLRRLLWRECEQHRPPDIYCFEKVTFGDRPAGCIVVSALQATADMFSHLSKNAAEVLKQDSYMDDTLSGSNTAKEAKELSSAIQAIAMKGGFNYKKFIFSGEYEDNGESKSDEKALGILWEPSEDRIKIHIELNHNKKGKGVRTEAVKLEAIPFSRRICLRMVNGIFDPIGIATPCTVKLKILMKNHFVANEKYKKWDTPIEPDESIEWIKVLKEILKLKNIAVPRHPLSAPYPTLSKNGKFTLVCFTDASQSAMCAAVYVRYEAVTGEVDSGLLAAKTKVSPVKPATMPKLELCASLLGARLSAKLITSIEQGTEKCFDTKYFFMDSKIALGVINKGHLTDEFNGNCAAEIRGKTESFIFGWVATEDNIADLGTRGAAPENIGNGSEWQKGPSWLREPIETWPIEIYPLERLPVIDCVQKSDSVINIDKFSDINKLHKHTALCLKFVKSKGNGKKSMDCNWKKIKLSPDDYRNAELFWIKRVSKSVIPLYNAQKLQSLRPSLVWDESGHFMRVVTSGRLGQLLKIGYDIEELTILNQNHPYTKLVLKECHDLDHGSDDKAVWKSRNKFWIPNARKIVKRIRKECYRCRLLNKRNAQQLMAPLPDTRVLPTPAWTFTSLDLFGPLEHADMVRKRLKEKCWGVLFTCRVSRAVHLDLTQGYDTDSLLQAIRRFMSLRGAPKEFLADQGSQMIACSKEIAGILELIDWNMVEGWCAKRSISWKFVPPQAQHMNGVTESLIRSTKNILKQTLDGKRLTYAETQTVLHEAAQTLNCRPLGIYSRPGSDPLNGGPITPNHLLLGRATTCIPDQKFVNVSKTKRMRFIQTCIKEFWTKWKMVVFHSLVPQYKWHKTQRNLQVNDIVLLNDDAGIVGEYKMGRVHSINTGKDGLVRSVQVRCAKEGKISKNLLDRPIHKLCVIVPVEEQQ